MIGRCRSISRLLMFHRVFSIAIDNLNAHLLRQGELDRLAGRGSQLGDALLKGLRHFLNLGHGDALLGGKILARDSGKADGLVHASFDGLGVGDITSRLDRGDHGDVVAGLLGNLLAVVVSIAMAITAIASGLAHRDHLGLALLVEGDLYGLGTGRLGLGLVGVGADLVVNLLDGLGADGPGDGVALLLVNDALPGQLDGVAHGLEGRHAHLSLFNDILNGAVVFGVFVTVTIGWSMVAVRWSRVAVRRSWMVGV